MEYTGDLASVPGVRKFGGSCFDGDAGLVYVVGGHSGDGRAHDSVCVIECIDILDNSSVASSASAGAGATSPATAIPMAHLRDPNDTPMFGSSDREQSCTEIDDPAENEVCDDTENDFADEIGDGTSFNSKQPPITTDENIPELIVRTFDVHKGQFIYRPANVGPGYSARGLLNVCATPAQRCHDTDGLREHLDNHQHEGEDDVDDDDDSMAGPLPPLLYSHRG